MEEDDLFVKSTLNDVDNLPKTLCRCCLKSSHNMKKITNFSDFLYDLANIQVSESDGLPQELCCECVMLLKKSVRFKHKVCRAHSMLNDYLNRCAPFPIDPQDFELKKYESPYLSATEVLTFDSEKSKSGFHKALEHKKIVKTSKLFEFELPPSNVDIPLGVVKNERDAGGFSDFEDNLPLDVYRSNATDKDLDVILQDDVLDSIKEEPKKVKRKKKDKDSKEGKKSKESKVGKKRKAEKEQSEAQEAGAWEAKPIRKAAQVDTNKIKIVILNPEEQVRQRQEESEAGLKFPYQCHLCYKGFNYEIKLENHMKKHSPSRGTFKCELCTMYLPTAYSASVHALIHTRRYECRRCGRRMVDRPSILEHYRSQHEGFVTLYTCKLCGKVSTNSKTHRGHVRNHHSAARPECAECGKSFVNKDSLHEHMQIHRGIKNYECDTCGAKFRTRTQAKHHQLAHSDAREFYCVECDARFKSAHTLRQHLVKSLKHKDTQSLEFPCTRCDKRFDTERSLHHHTLIQHEGVRNYQCSECGAALASANSLAKHVRSVHAGRRPPARHVCDTCGRAFRGKSVLVNHVRTHTGEKPFACAECGRAFTQRAAMRTHLRLVHLKQPRTPKVKPETAPVTEAKLDMNKDVHLLDWRPQPFDYFTVTAGP